MIEVCGCGAEGSILVVLILQPAPYTCPANMDSSGDDFDSDQEPDYLSDEEEMEFLDQQPKASAESKAKSSVWGVIDKSVLAHVQVTWCTAFLLSSRCTNHVLLGLF